MFDIRFTWFYHCLSLKVSSSQSPNAFVFGSRCLAPDHTRWFKKWMHNKWMSSQVPDEWKVIWMNLGLFSFGSMVHKVIKKNGLPSHSHSVKKTVSVWTLFIVFLIESVREVNVKNILCTKRKGNSCIICLSIRCYNKAQPSPYDWGFVGVGIIKQFFNSTQEIITCRQLSEFLWLVTTRWFKGPIQHGLCLLPGVHIRSMGQLPREWGSLNGGIFQGKCFLSMLLFT